MLNRPLSINKHIDVFNGIISTMASEALSVVLLLLIAAAASPVGCGKFSRSLTGVASTADTPGTAVSAPVGACGWPGHCLGDRCRTLNDCDGDLICVDGKCSSSSGGGAPGSPRTPPEGCSWVGHCVGDPCQTANDCDASLVCVAGKCGTAGGSPPSGGGQGRCPAGWYEGKLTVYDSWPYPNSQEWKDYSGGKYLGIFAYKQTSAACNEPGEVFLTSWSTPDGGSGRIPAGCHWRHDWVASQKIAAVFKSASSPVVDINFKTQVAGQHVRVASIADARSGSAGTIVYVADTCGNDDCNDCCSSNANKSASKFLIDLEKNALKAVFPAIKGFRATRIRYFERQASYQGSAFDGNSITDYPGVICFKLM